MTHVNSIIAGAVHEGLFGLFATLDGARVIDDGKGRFELSYVTDKQTLLNVTQDISLHDLFNATN